MHRLAIGLVVVGLAGAACNRNTDAAALNGGQPGAGASAIATTGAREPARDAATRETTTPGTGIREVTIPAGTVLPIVLDTSIGSDTSRVEQPVRAHLSRAISMQGQTVLPEGTIVGGVVSDAQRSAKVKGRAHVAVRFETLTPRGTDERYQIQTAAIGRTAAATKKKDALEIGAPAAGGAIIGALVGGKKGAAIGTAVGGGAGTAVVLSTRGKEIHLPAGAALQLRLTAPVTIRVAG